MKQQNTKALVVVGGLLLAAATSFALWSSVEAANRYSFTARGIVTGLDTNNLDITVDVAKAPGKAQDDLESKITEFDVIKTVKVVKQVNGKDKPVTLSHATVGKEIAFKGVAKDDDTYQINFIRISDRSFEVLGEIKEHDTAARTVKILIKTSSYKAATYKGQEITMNYNDNSTFYEKNTKTELSPSDLAAEDQKVKIKGSITSPDRSTNTWEISTLINNYKGK